MANELNGEVTFPVGDVTYTLRLDIERIIGLEDQVDLSCGEIVERLRGRVKIGFLRTVLAAALEEHHPKLAKGEVAKMIATVGVLGSAVAAITAIAAAFPKPRAAEAAADDPPLAAAGTGSDT